MTCTKCGHLYCACVEQPPTYTRSGSVEFLASTWDEPPPVRVTYDVIELDDAMQVIHRFAATGRNLDVQYHNRKLTLVLS